MRSGLSLTGAILAGILILAPAGSPAQETSAPGADPALEQAIHDYILAHPEVIAESLQKFQQQQEDAQKQAHAQAVKDLKPQLVSNSASPVLGNPAGDVTVVEFLDYRCPYCKAMHQSIADMIAADGNVRVVVKEFPDPRRRLALCGAGGAGRRQTRQVCGDAHRPHDLQGQAECS